MARTNHTGAVDSKNYIRATVEITPRSVNRGDPSCASFPLPPLSSGYSNLDD